MSRLVQRVGNYLVNSFFSYLAAKVCAHLGNVFTDFLDFLSRSIAGLAGKFQQLLASLFA